MFLGKTLISHGASLHPGVLMGTSNLNAGSVNIQEGGGVEILSLVAPETGISSGLMSYLGISCFHRYLLPVQSSIKGLSANIKGMLTFGRNPVYKVIIILQLAHLFFFMHMFSRNVFAF